MQSRTIYSIDSAKLDKSELDILYFIDGWLPTFSRWSVLELGQKCNLFAADAVAAVDMLILHGLMANDGTDDLMGRMVTVPREAQEWIAENSEAINGLCTMNNTDLFDDTEIAEA
jgi:hypothetical protein